MARSRLRSKTGRTTLKEVAERAGVAMSTASGALNGKGFVTEETRQRVLRAAEELDYSMNTVAQSLATGRSGNVAIFLSGSSSFQAFDNPVFLELIKAVSRTLVEYRLNAQLHVISHDDELAEIRGISSNRTVDGLIFVGTRAPDSELAAVVREIRIPSVITVRRSVDHDVPHVSIDNWNCGFVATQHLLSLGHVRIGFIGHLPGVSIAADRFAGYEAALTRAGLGVDDDLVVHGDYYQRSGHDAMLELLDRAEPPTAVFAANDLMALGALEALRARGIGVPDEMSLVGSDDIPNLHLIDPPLTSVSTSFEEVGAAAARTMARVIEGMAGMGGTAGTAGMEAESDPGVPGITVASELRIRGSTAEAVRKRR